ncbi:MAG: hypothetical protein KDD62_16100, partial [Bdellovibrionales bacterium]|nr:hypothetical protein [Bdellovibrionales bacterium]
MLTSEFEILCPEFTILDVTLRDGGFSVNFHWKEEEVFTLLSTLTSNGVSHIELGYLGGLPDKHGVSAPGPASNVSISLIEKISHKFPSIKPILMIHPSASEISLPLRQYRDAGLYGVRVVYHKSWRENFLRLMEQVSKCEMFNCTNLALVSQYAEQHLLKEIEFLAALGPDVIYAADTCSALAPEHVKRIYKLLLSCCSVELGFHGHDFIGLGLANCLAAANNGAR